MHFSVVRPDEVQAVSQRWLLKFWKHHLGKHRVPRWQSVQIENLARVATQLSILEVTGGDGTARFLIAFHGEAIGRVYGSADCRGKYLDEIMPPAGQPEGLAPYHHVLEACRPVYTVQDLTDRNGTLLYYERLLLPYSLDGQHVDHILASFEFICPDGAFQRDALMKSLGAPPVLKLSATIEPQALS